MSTLVSNPNPQDIVLTSFMTPKDNGDGSTFRVPLRRFGDIHLVGELRCVFRLLDRLPFPGTLDSMSLTVLDPAIEDVLQTSGLYLRGYFWGDPWFQGRLRIGFHYSISQWSSPLTRLLHSRQYPGRASWREHVPVASICDVQSDFNRRGPSGRPGQSVPRSRHVHPRRTHEPFQEKRFPRARIKWRAYLSQCPLKRWAPPTWCCLKVTFSRT